MAERRQSEAATRVVITGAFHGGLERRLMRDLVARAARTGLSRVTVVVPTNLLRLRLARELAGETGAHAGFRFLTLKDLASATAPRPLPEGRVPLPGSGDETLLRRLLDGGAADGGYFSSIADRPGLARALLSAVRDLKEAGLSPDSFERAARRSGLWSRGPAGKMRSLHAIWNAYENAMGAGGWIDDADLMTIAAGAVPENASPLVVYGFYDLNAIQRRLILAFADVTRTRVYFPYVETDAYRFARATLEWLESCGFEREDIGQTERSGAAPGTMRSELPLPPETLIVSAPGEGREAREDTRKLRTVLSRDAVPFRDSAVLLRSADTYSDIFAAEAGHIGARPYVEAMPHLSATPSGKCLLRLAHAVASDFARPDVIEFLNLADIQREDPGEAPKSDWNRISIVAGVVSGREQWESGLARVAGRLERSAPGSRFQEQNGSLAPALPELASVLAEVFDGLDGLPGKAEPALYLDALLKTFRNVTRPSAEREAVVGAASGVRTLSEISGPVGFRRFVEMLRSALTAPCGRDVRFEEGGPGIHNLMSARGLRFDVVVLPGLVERAFPLARRQDPILLDGERARLNEATGDGLTFLPLRADGAAEEELLFNLAVESAERTLILSFPRLDPATARPRIPSVYLLRVLESLTGHDQDYESFERDPLVLRVPLSRRFPDDRADAMTRDEFDGCSILSAVQSARPEEVAYLFHESGPLGRSLAMEETRWGAHRFTEYDGALRSPEALAAARKLCGLFGDGGKQPHPASATALEEYASCPFRFLARRLLGIEPVEEPSEDLELSPKDRGTLYHGLFESFMKAAREHGGLPLSADRARLLLEQARKVVERGDWGLVPGPGAVELILQDMTPSLVLWLQYELSRPGTLVPSYFEARFGGPVRQGDDDISSEKTLRYRVSEDTELEFGGKIDRIDVAPDGSSAEVVDYKTGAAKPAGRTFDRGRNLQLPFYLMAAEQLLAAEHGGASVDSAEYLHVGPEGPRARRLTAETLAEKDGDLRRAVSLILHGIGEGMFFPYPTTSGGCRSCDYADVCGSAAVTALAVIKNADPRASFFVSELLEIE